MTLTKICKFCGTPMQPCLSIPTDVGDVVLRQPLMVLSGYGFGSTASNSPRRGARIGLREPISRIYDARASHSCGTARRAGTGCRMAQTAARRVAAAAKRHAATPFERAPARQLGRSSTTLFTCWHPFGCNPCSFKTGSSYSVRALLRSSLCKREIRFGFISSMDKCGPSQQRRLICVGGTND